jgi:predicted phosphodiesterase
MAKERIACFGGVYSNYLALASAILDAQGRGVDAIYCLGDMGAFGPHPDRVFPQLHDAGVMCLQGNYDDSIGNQLDDCQCGYTDPRDNHFAQISYDYTLEKTSAANREFMAGLPAQRRISLGPLNILLCHGSPRRVNEFLWESTTSTAFLNHLVRRKNVDVIAATHTGLKWCRKLDGGRQFVNVGVLGRPENDGATNVWYTVFEYDDRTGLRVEFIPVVYDHERLAREMESERLPCEFVQTIRTGWWTTCLEILPSKERRQGQY